MELKDIVCDFKYAERLNSLGVLKRSLFFTWGNKYGDTLIFMVGSYEHEVGGRPMASINTYTVAELGEMLPSTITCDDCEESSTLRSSICGSSYALYYSYFSNPVFKLVRAKKEANARAKLLIWLIENNHVNVDELNNN